MNAVFLSAKNWTPEGGAAWIAAAKSDVPASGNPPFQPLVTGGLWKTRPRIQHQLKARFRFLLRQNFMFDHLVQEPESAMYDYVIFVLRCFAERLIAGQ
jgi:hypothetical protein